MRENERITRLALGLERVGPETADAIRDVGIGEVHLERSQVAEHRFRIEIGKARPCADWYVQNWFV